ncbi:hypothetical protein [Spirosoma koreense]
MKSVLSLPVVFLLIAFHRPTPPVSADDVLQRTLARLTALKTVRYQYYRDVNYRSESYRNELSGSMYLDFQQGKNPVGFWFQIDSDVNKLIYNGETLLTLDKTEKTMRVEKQPSINSFSSISFFYNSIVTLRNSLKFITADTKIPKTLVDTTVYGKPCYQVRFALQSRVLENLGRFKELTTERVIIYKVIVDKQTYLPTLVLQTNNVTPQDYVLTRFSEYSLDGVKPADTSWYYLTYVSEYKPFFQK